LNSATNLDLELTTGDHGKASLGTSSLPPRVKVSIDPLFDILKRIVGPFTSVI